MLAIQAHCHDGHIQINPQDQQSIPQDADVIVLFLPKSPMPRSNAATAIADMAGSLSPEQRAAWQIQSQTGFAQADLLQPAEDVWNHA